MTNIMNHRNINYIAQINECHLDDVWCICW